MKRIMFGLAVLAAVSVAANAAQFRFHDYSESPDIAWLTVDGTQVTGNGPYGGGTISNFDANQYYLNVGERIKFDYQYTDTSVATIGYTKLMGGPDELGLVSDEFLGWTTGNGVFHFDFISYDSADGVMASEHPGLALPAPTTLTELPEWQLVGSIVDPYPNGPTHDTFEVMSIPEPATCTIMLAGLGLLAAVVRRR